jgi:hypothetical protein
MTHSSTSHARLQAMHRYFLTFIAGMAAGAILIFLFFLAVWNQFKIK